MQRKSITNVDTAVLSMLVLFSVITELLFY